MRFTSDTQRRGWVAAIAGATLLAGGHAMALGCLDIPGAKIDPALNASAANQSYGRLFPEFKSRQKTIEAKRALPIDRLVGKRLQVDGGTGHVWLALTPDGSTEITAVAGDRVATHTTPSRLAGEGGRAI